MWSSYISCRKDHHVFLSRSKRFGPSFCSCRKEADLMKKVECVRDGLDQAVSCHGTAGFGWWMVEVGYNVVQQGLGKVKSKIDFDRHNTTYSYRIFLHIPIVNGMYKLNTILNHLQKWRASPCCNHSSLLLRK